MSSDWPMLPLGEITACLDSQRVPVREADRKPGPYPYYGASGVVDHVQDYLFDGEYVLVAEDGENLRSRKLPIAFMAEGKFWVNNHAHILRGSGVARTRYVCYALQASEISAYLSGSTMPKLTRGNLQRILVPVPPTDVQDRIVDLLGGLDDRIALLNNTNSTLDAIAQAVFKSWFVDFDPVRARASGLEPAGIDPNTAALFPPEFEESQLGPVPKGWTVSALKEHIQVDRGLSYRGSALCSQDDGFPMHNLNSVHEGGGYKYEGIKYYRGEFQEKHTVRGGEIIVANTEQGHEHRLIGYPAITPKVYDRAIYSHHIYRLRLCPESPLTTLTLYYLLMSPTVREQIVSYSNGSTVNMLKNDGLQAPRFVCPSSAVARAFDSLATPLCTAMEENVKRSELLTTIRDTLLPRLISGKLRIPEAQEAVEEVLA